MTETDYIRDIYRTMEGDELGRSTIALMCEEYEYGKFISIKHLASKYYIDIYTASEIIIKVLSLKKIEHPVTIVLMSKV